MQIVSVLQKILQPCTALNGRLWHTVYICSYHVLIISVFSVTLWIDPTSLLLSVNVRRLQLENEKHLCSAVSRKSGEVLKGTGMCGKRTLVKCSLPH